MSLQPPFLLPTTLEELDAADVAIVQHTTGWFARCKSQWYGPFDTPAAALSAGIDWRNEHCEPDSSELSDLPFDENTSELNGLQ